MKITTIDLLRHGLPEGGEIFRGRTDVALSAEGWQQMRTATELGASPWTQVLHSPLSRCRDFAVELAEKANIPRHENSDFREIDFGDWDGVSFDEVKKTYPDQVKRYWQNPLENTPPNGEPMSEFSARLDAGWQRILNECAGEHVLLISHGGVMRVLLATVLQMPLAAVSRFEIPYACLSRVKIYQHEGFEPWPQLVFHGGGHQQERITDWYSSDKKD